VSDHAAEVAKLVEKQDPGRNDMRLAYEMVPGEGLKFWYGRVSGGRMVLTRHGILTDDGRLVILKSEK